jgi:hypothetical protein
MGFLMRSKAINSAELLDVIKNVTESTDFGGGSKTFEEWSTEITIKVMEHLDIENGQKEIEEFVMEILKQQLGSDTLH